MRVKVMMVFKQIQGVFATGLLQNVLDTTESRTAGWSEGYYQENNSLDVIRNRARELAELRAACLGASSVIHVLRYQLIDEQGAGPVQSEGRIFPGNAAWPVDVPQMGLEVRLAARDSLNVGRIRLAGIPDLFVQLGVFAPSPDYQEALREYIRRLWFADWRFRARDLNKPLQGPFEIEEDGRITGPALVNPQVGAYYRTWRMIDQYGRSISGRFILRDTDPPSEAYLLEGWNPALIGEGRLREDAIIYPMFSEPPRANATFQLKKMIVQRPVGRPTDSYRGRQRRRRRGHLA